MTTLSIPGKQFRSAFAAAAIARSRDGSRPVLGCLHVFRKDDTLVLECTDSYRLHRTMLRLEYGALKDFPEDFERVLHLEAAHVRWVSELSNTPLPIQVSFTRDSMEISDDERSVKLRVLDGNPFFPDATKWLEDAETLGTLKPTAFNPSLLTDVCTAARLVNSTYTGTIQLTGWTDPMKPVFFTAHGDGVDLLALLMPVRIS